MYYWYPSSVYYSADGVTWTDLSDRQWVQDAAPYCYSSVGPMGHREFEFIWTGTEYMMRQSLLDDPRGAYQRHGDSPRNNRVTFLDEEFQIIGERAFDSPVTGIRYENGVYYATADGMETAFSRQAWTSESLFRDVAPDDWFAPYVEVCAAEGLMQGTGEDQFSPNRVLLYEELVVLTARLHHILTGGNGILPKAPENYGRSELTLADGSRAPFQMDACNQWGGRGSSTVIFGFPAELAADYTGQSFTLTLHLENSYRYTGTLLQSQTLSNPSPEYLLCIETANGSDAALLQDREGKTQANPLPSWVTDAIFYIHQTSLFSVENSAMGTPAVRRQLVEPLNACLSDENMVQLNHIEEIPDLAPAALSDTHFYDPLRLYRAGILTGSDQYGTFYGQRTLTRAEASAILSRALNPSLRTSFTPETPEWYLDYTLEPLSDSYVQAIAESAYHDSWCDLTMTVNRQTGALVFRYSTGQPIESELPSDFSGRIYLEEQYQQRNDPDSSLSNARDARTAGYDTSLTAPYTEDGIAVFVLNDGPAYGYYSQDGLILIPARFAWAGALVGGTAIVQTHDGTYCRLTVNTNKIGGQTS